MLGVRGVQILIGIAPVTQRLMLERFLFINQARLSYKP